MKQTPLTFHPKMVTLIMPFSFTGFSSAALIIMVLVLMVAQGVDYLRHRKSH